MSRLLAAAVALMASLLLQFPAEAEARCSAPGGYALLCKAVEATWQPAQRRVCGKKCVAQCAHDWRQCVNRCRVNNQRCRADCLEANLQCQGDSLADCRPCGRGRICCF